VKNRAIVTSGIDFIFTSCWTGCKVLFSSCAQEGQLSLPDLFVVTVFLLFLFSIIIIFSVSELRPFQPGRVST